MPIPSTLGLIVKCWQDAENELRASIEEKHPDLDEEFITRLFCDELAFLLRKASSEGTIRQAFLIDLQNAFPEIESDSELTSVSDNLIADISLHKREVEKITGGDFGLTITRPQMLFDPPSDWSPHYGHLQITEYQRGLLCQAKIKRRTDKWGSLSKRQKDVFPSRMKYLGLLLYEYSDKERRKLKEFGWQPCQNASLTKIERWLKSDRFPSVTNSAEIIHRLGNSEIGTDDKEILENVIRPTGKPCVHIRIFWPSDKRPPSSFPVHVYSSIFQQEHEVERQQIYLRNG